MLPPLPPFKQPGQLDTVKQRIRALPWWVNFMLGLAGAFIATPYGPRVGVPWYIAAGAGFAAGFTLPGYLFELGGLVMAFFVIVALLLLGHHYRFF